MKLKWTEQALEGFRNIRNQYYTQSETAQYKNACSKVFKQRLSSLVQGFQYNKMSGKVVIKLSLINLLSITPSRKNGTSVILGISGIQVNTTLNYIESMKGVMEMKNLKFQKVIEK